MDRRVYFSLCEITAHPALTQFRHHGFTETALDPDQPLAIGLIG